MGQPHNRSPHSLSHSQHSSWPLFITLLQKRFVKVRGLYAMCNSMGKQNIKVKGRI